MPDPQYFCTNILREKHYSSTTPPDDRQIDIAIIAFGGGGMNDVREIYPKLKIATIANSIRAVCAAIRRGEVPDKIKEQFPYIVSEQQAYAKSPASRPTSALVRKVKALARSITKPIDGSLVKWLDRAKLIYAPVAVPATIQKMLEGVESGDPEMIKLSSQVFHLLPQGGKGPALAAQFNFPGSGQEKKLLPAHRQSPYFEKILRDSRARIDSEQSQTVEVAVTSEENEEDAEAET